MDISAWRLTGLLLYSLLYGAVLGGIYDLFRITRVLMGIHYTDKFRALKIKVKLRFPKTQRRSNKTSRKVNRKKHHIICDSIIFIEDILFMIIAGIFVCLLCYYFNDGVFRWFSPAFLALGFVIYYYTLGKLVMLISEALAYILKTVILYVGFIIAYPAVFLFVKTVTVVGRIISAVRKTKLQKFDVKERARLLRDADRGFLTKLIRETENPKQKRTKNNRKVTGKTLI